MVKNCLRWFIDLINNCTAKDRNDIYQITLNDIEYYNKGKSTKKGKEYVEYLKNKCEFIGFCPNIMYSKQKGSKEELEAMYVHPIGQTALLYYVKDSPFLLIANSSIRFNESALSKIKGNKNISEIFDVLGITG